MKSLEALFMLQFCVINHSVMFFFHSLFIRLCTFSLVEKMSGAKEKS